MHVMRDGTQVVKKLGINGPPAIPFPDVGSEQHGAAFGDRIPQQEGLVFKDTKAQTFVPLPIFIGRLGRTGEPTLIDPAAISTQCVVIVGMQAETPPGMQKTPGYPGGGQTQQARAVVKS